MSVPAFLSAAAGLAKQYPATGGKVDVISLASQVAATERAIHPEAVALALFAALAGVIALTVIVQLLARQLTLDSAEFPVLRALGMTRGRLVGLSLARTAVVTVAGGLVAVAIAIAASPVMPIGAARLAEPDPGVQVNLAVLAAGFAVFALVPLALLSPAAWAAATRAQGPLGVAEPGRPGRVSRLAALAGRTGPVTGGIGVRMAFEPGHGRTAVPVRSALIGTTVAIASVLAAVVFGTSLISLVYTPHRYGQNWTQMLDLAFGGVSGPLAAKILATDPAVATYAAGNYGQLSVGTSRTIVPAIGIDPARGRDFLTLLAGRAPVAAGEIVLGAQTMQAVHARLGQAIRVTVNQVANPPSYRRVTWMMRVVGEAVFPAFSRGSFTPTDLGTGAAVPAAVLSERFPQTGCTGRVTCYNFLLLRYPPGTDLRAAGARLTTTLPGRGARPARAWPRRPAALGHQELQRGPGHPVAAGRRPGAAGGGHDGPCPADQRPAAAPRSGHAQGSRPGPAAGARRGAVAGGHAGRDRAAVRRAARHPGRPVGLGAVRGRSGCVPGASIPVPLVLASIPVTVALAALIAAWPARAAARVRPATVLRAE